MIFHIFVAILLIEKVTPFSRFVENRRISRGMNVPRMTPEEEGEIEEFEKLLRSWNILDQIKASIMKTRIDFIIATDRLEIAKDRRKIAKIQREIAENQFEMAKREKEEKVIKLFSDDDVIAEEQNLTREVFNVWLGRGKVLYRGSRTIRDFDKIIPGEEYRLSSSRDDFD